jgi:hypothetical protein
VVVLESLVVHGGVAWVARITVIPGLKMKKLHWIRRNSGEVVPGLVFSGYFLLE